MPFTGDSFTHLFDWVLDPQRQEKIINSRLEAEFDGIDTGLSAVAARVTATEAAVTTAAAAVGFAAGRLRNLALASSVAGNALTIAVKDAAGNDPSSASPVVIDFRGATAATGTPSTLQVTSATSLVISSGSSMGFSNNVPGRLWVVGFNDAGTFRLGAINCRSGANIFPLAGWGIASSTAEGGAGGADSAHTFYTGTAVSSKAYAVLGYLTWETALATAGTWSSDAGRKQIFDRTVRLPGSYVQTVYAQTNSAVTTTSTSFQNTNLSANLAPTSAANVVEYATAASLQIISANLCQAHVAVFRDATQTFSMTEAYNDNGGIANAVMGVSNLGIDQPNTTSAIAYTARIRAAQAPTTHIAYPGGNSSATMVLKEIMA